MTTNQIGEFIIVKDIVNQPFLLATSYKSKLKTDKTLIEELSKINFKGEVFVDMLLKVGNSSQRFYSTFFNGKNFDMKNTKQIEQKDKILKTLLKIEKDIICLNKNILDSNILTDHDKISFCSKA